MDTERIRRRLDGSIDIDFYRQRGLSERRVVMTRVFKRMGFARPLVAAVILAVALYVAPFRPDVSQTEGRNAVAQGAASSVAR